MRVLVTLFAFAALCFAPLANAADVEQEVLLFTMKFEVVQPGSVYSTGWQTLTPTAGKPLKELIVKGDTGCQKMAMVSLKVKTAGSTTPRSVSHIRQGTYDTKGHVIDAAEITFQSYADRISDCNIAVYGLPLGKTSNPPFEQPEDEWTSRATVQRAAKAVTSGVNLLKLDLKTVEAYATLIAGADLVRTTSRDLLDAIEEGATRDQALALFVEVEKAQTALAKEFYKVHGNVLNAKVEGRWFALANDYQELRSALGVDETSEDDDSPFAP